MTYAIRITPTALEMIRGVRDRRVNELIQKRIDQLSQDPDKQGKELHGELRGYRCVHTAGQRYRILYRVEATTRYRSCGGSGDPQRRRQEGHLRACSENDPSRPHRTDRQQVTHRWSQSMASSYCRISCIIAFASPLNVITMVSPLSSRLRRTSGLSLPDYFVQSFYDLFQLFRKDLSNLLAYPFRRERPYLADLHPRRLWKIGVPDFKSEGKPARCCWLVRARAMTVPDFSLNTSWLITTTGLTPACSLPLTGLRSAQTISPLSIRAIRRSPSHLLPPYFSQIQYPACHIPPPGDAFPCGSVFLRPHLVWPDSCLGTSRRHHSVQPDQRLLVDGNSDLCRAHHLPPLRYYCRSYHQNCQRGGANST